MFRGVALNIGELLTEGYNILKTQDIDTYILDSQLLLQKVLKKDKLFIILNRDFMVDKEKQEEFLKLINLRKDKMPIKYILGECEFMGLSFNVREGVLIPRGDTEVLVEEVIGRINEKKYREVCDVCCGSGAIGLSIAKLTETTKVYCYDISDIAYEVTKENIEKLGLEPKAKVFKSDLLSEAINEGKVFDVVVSNPPYIRRDVIPTLMEDVRDYEPYIALCGGEDGLDFYRKITEQSLQVLNPGGLLAFEIGHDQRETVEAILKDKGFVGIKSIVDLAGLDRVVLGTKGNQ